MHKRLTEDLKQLAEVDAAYAKEVELASVETTRGLTLKREKWQDYVRHLEGTHSRERLMQDWAVEAPPAERVRKWLQP